MGVRHNNTVVVGVLSDTHGELCDAAVRALSGVDHIIHAGDICSGAILPALRDIAPTTAVAGNMDLGHVAGELPATQAVEVGGVLIYVLHDLNRLDLVPEDAGVQVVVYGHTHRAEIERQDGVIYLNPGSAGDPRYLRGPTLALLTISGADIEARIVSLG
jgi:putative phosphoesterase